MKKEKIEMINSKKIAEYKKRIDSLGDWYQPIIFIPDVLETKSRYGFKSTIHGINKWNFILRRNLPNNIKGKRILDIGCASGFYSMLCAREGAQVIGVELDEEGYKQSLLTREIFSELDGVDYRNNFEILKIDLMDFNWDQYPDFDIVMALNVLYWIKMPYYKIAEKDKRFYNDANLIDLVKNIKEHSKMFLVQADENKYWVRKKKGRSTEATDSKRVVGLLRKCGYKKIKVDKPIAIRSLFNTITGKISEVEIRNPIFYSRPIVKAES